MGIKSLQILHEQNNTPLDFDQWSNLIQFVKKQTQILSDTIGPHEMTFLSSTFALLVLAIYIGLESWKLNLSDSGNIGITFGFCVAAILQLVHKIRAAENMMKQVNFF